MAKRRRRKWKREPSAASHAEISTMPLPERGTHDQIIRSEKAISDEEGRIARPYMVLDVLARMQDEGKITPEMRAAGEDFHALFRRAQFDSLVCIDLSRPHVSGIMRGVLEPRAEMAQRRLNERFAKLGGRDTVWGRCAYEVLGLEKSLTEWVHDSQEKRRHGWASGILIATLAKLAELPVSHARRRSG